MDTTPARDALATLVRLWPTLAEAVGARQQTDWPPAMGISRMREPDEHGDGRAGDVRQLPIDVEVFDSMREMEAALVTLADRIASEIQRPAMSHAPHGIGWTAAYRQRHNQLADRDAADPRRWRYTGQRTGRYAAGWLYARLVERPSAPFRPLALQHVSAITATATASATRVERLLRIARRRTSTGRTHDGCGGDITVSGGDGTDPEAQCERCGRMWRPIAAA